MKALQESERRKIEEEKRAREQTFGKTVEVRMNKDLCILKFPMDGTRLMVKRWSKGFVIHPPRYRPSLGTPAPSLGPEMPSPAGTKDVKKEQLVIPSFQERVRQEGVTLRSFRGRLAAALDTALITGDLADVATTLPENENPQQAVHAA